MTCTANITKKQQLFIQEYLIDLNATAAAQRAGYKDGNYGRQLLTLPNVSEAIMASMKERAAALHITSEWVVERLIQEATDHGEGSSQAARIRALELLGKHLGMFEDRLHLSGKVAVVSADDLTDDELAVIAMGGTLTSKGDAA